MEVAEEHQLMESPRTSPRNHRPRLLHSWGSSLVSVAHKIYGKAAEPNDRIGTLVRMLAWIASPFLNPIQRKWLATLSFIDDVMLFFENIAMAVFPPTAHIFTMVDDLALLGELLPKKFDSAVDSLLPLLHQMPLFDAVMKSLFSERWSSSDESSSDERDIMIDMNYCDEQPKVAETSAKEEAAGDSTEEVAKLSQDKVWNANSIKNGEKEVKGACKEIMDALEEMGMTVEDKKAYGEVGAKAQAEEKVVQRESGDVEAKDNPILDLFDEGWQLKPIGKKVGDLGEQMELPGEIDEQQELLAEDDEVDPVEEQAEIFMDNYAHRTSKCRSRDISKEEAAGDSTEEVAKLSQDKVWNANSTKNDEKEVEDACKEIKDALKEMGMTVEDKEAYGEVGAKAQAEEKLVQRESGDVEAKGNPILDLSDEGWQLKPIGKKGRQRK